MNLQDINNVSDLVKANQEPIEEQKEISDEALIILKKIYAENPSVGLEVVKSVLSSLATYHKDCLDNAIEEDSGKAAAVWAVDYANLSSASDLIDYIVL